MARIIVEYDGLPEFSVSGKMNRDEKLEQFIGKPCSGSGYNFRDGLRDIGWNISDPKKALAIVRSLNKSKRKFRIEGAYMLRRGKKVI